MEHKKERENEGAREGKKEEERGRNVGGTEGIRELGRTRCFTVRLLDVNFEFIWHLLSEQQWYLVSSDKNISSLLTSELL